MNNILTIKGLISSSQTCFNFFSPFVHYQCHYISKLLALGLSHHFSHICFDVDATLHHVNLRSTCGQVMLIIGIF
jgi:hypothetical protein